MVTMREEENHETGGRFYLNSDCKRYTENNLTDNYLDKGKRRTIGSDPVNQTVSKLLRSLLSKGVSKILALVNAFVFDLSQ